MAGKRPGGVSFAHGEKPLGQAGASGEGAEGALNALVARGVTKVFGEGPAAVRAVDGVDLNLARGEVALVMGPSGSGKTTLLFLLGALLRPTSGAVEVNGAALTARRESDLPELRRKHFGFVFQDFNLLANLTALENVEIALNLAGVRGAEARRRSRTLLRELGLRRRLDHLPETLSGGEKQRVAIARALANEPPVILADEPTANLDREHGRQVVALLRDTAREHGTAVLMVSHDARITEVADRLLIMEDGRLRGMGK